MSVNVPPSADNPLAIEIISSHHDNVIGVADPETEAKFGSITISSRAVNNISRLSLLHLEDEVGGFLVGWEENGIRHIADTLAYIPENAKVGQFHIMDGEEFMLNALESMRENPDYADHHLEVLGWWHTHTPEMRAEDGFLIPAMTPIPTGGILEGRAATGDLGVTDYYSHRFRKPQEMLIVQTVNRDQPPEFALWRWDDTPEVELAHYQKGLRVADVEPTNNVEYWELPEGGNVTHSLRIRNEDIMQVEVEEDIPSLNQEADEPISVEIPAEPITVNIPPETVTVTVPDEPVTISSDELNQQMEEGGITIKPKSVLDKFLDLFR